jgi:pimeloyl-ACP methyl ester carboxylesterase
MTALAALALAFTLRPAVVHETGRSAAGAAASVEPAPLGPLVDLSGHRLHVHCSGKGRPTVVVESGFYEFSSDWALVQSRVAAFSRICTYDRAGHAWSDPGPFPRTFDQITLELRDALGRLGENPPYVLVGHSFGGPVVRHFAAVHPDEVAGVVLVDSAQEDQRVVIQGRAVRLRASATGKPIPAPREYLLRSEQPRRARVAPPASAAVEPPLDRLPPRLQQLHLWAAAQPELEDAQGSEREWSPEYFARWAAAPQEASLGEIPLVVLTRAEGGHGGEIDVPASELEAERLELQRRLVRLSRNGRQVIVSAGHDMHLEAPDAVAQAIREVVDAARRRSAPPRPRHVAAP